MSVPQTQSEALQKLEEQLTCSICLDQYTDAKILPCFHSFCLECLKGVPLDLDPAQQGNYSLPCPICRSPCQLPEQGADALSSSFNINNLTEVYNLLKKVKGKGGHTSCDKCQKNNGDRYCKQCAKFLCQQCLQQHDEWMNSHETLGLDELQLANAVHPLPQAKLEVVVNKCKSHDSPMEIFCETCKELICQQCRVQNHKDHKHDAVNDAYARHKLIIKQSSLQPLDQKINIMVKALANLVGRRKEIAEQGKSAKQMAHEAIANIKELLDQIERKIGEDVDRVMEYKFTITDHQTREGQAVLGRLKEWKDHVEHSLEVDTPCQVLSTKAQVVNHTESLLATVKEEKFKPIEQADLRLVRNDKTNLEDIIGFVGALKYSIAPPTVTMSFDHTPIVGQESTVNMSLSLKDGLPAPVSSSLISCHLTPPTSPSSPDVLCSVKGTSQSGQYYIVFTPHTRGSHQLHIKLQGRTIPGSPVNIPASVPVTARGCAVRTITGLKKPDGVAVTDDGQVIILERDGSRITIVTRDGKRVRSFGSRGKGRGQFIKPSGIAITSKGTLLVVDRGNNLVQEFTMDGKCISCVGSKGNGPRQFNRPRGVAINKSTGQVYVVDSYNHRVQIFNDDLKFDHTIGCQGSGQGQFSFPFAVTIDNQGFVYIADHGNNRIQKFTPDDRFVSSFGSLGSKRGQLSKPSSISIDNDLLYVSELEPNHRISVYTTAGECVHCFGSLQFPIGAVVDAHTGYLYACDDKGVHLF